MAQITQDVEQFFYDHAGWSYDPAKETAEEGRRQCAKELAEAEAWGRKAGLEFDWQDDWEIGNHGEFYGPGSAYEDAEPERCEQVSARLNGEVVASLGCVDDASDEYRRVVEAELAAEARHR